MGAMKFYFFSHLFLHAVFSIAQNDTLFFDEHWNVSNKEKASYYRLPTRIKNNEYSFSFHYTSGQKLCTGRALDIHAAVPDGKVTFYWKDGTIEQELVFISGDIHPRDILFSQKSHIAYDWITGRIKDIAYYPEGSVKYFIFGWSEEEFTIVNYDQKKGHLTRIDAYTKTDIIEYHYNENKDKINQCICEQQSYFPYSCDKPYQLSFGNKALWVAGDSVWIEIFNAGKLVMRESYRLDKCTAVPHYISVFDSNGKIIGEALYDGKYRYERHGIFYLFKKEENPHDFDTNLNNIFYYNYKKLF